VSKKITIKNPPRKESRISVVRSPDRRLVFNFSFLTHDRKYGLESRQFSKDIKSTFLTNLSRLSQAPFEQILLLDKRHGLERLPQEQVNFSMNQDFVKSGRFEACLTGLWIFRLNTKGRVIGMVLNETFYILAFDLSFSTYRH